MHLYLGADFAKYLFGSVCAGTHTVVLNIVTCHLLVCFLRYFHHMSFLDVSSAGQGLDYSWHLGSSLFHLIDFYSYMSFENQRKVLCCLSALVPQGLCKVNW